MLKTHPASRSRFRSNLLAPSPSFYIKSAYWNRSRLVSSSSCSFLGIAPSNLSNFVMNYMQFKRLTEEQEQIAQEQEKKRGRPYADSALA